MRSRATLPAFFLAALLAGCGSDSGGSDGGGRRHVEVTPSGLTYEVVREGTGASPTADDLVTVNYEGTLQDGTVFDSSYARGKPVTFSLRRVIQGWKEGIPLMKEGAEYRFTIPAGLAYANRPPPGSQIPPGATLRFRVELLKVLKVPTGDEPATRREELPSGLVHEVIREGEGASPTRNDTVTVLYKGWLDDGTVFDSAYERGQPATFSLSSVISGWQEGIPRMKVGGESRFTIPGDLAYGTDPPEGSGIPPGATLHFQVVLLDVRN